METPIDSTYPDVFPLLKATPKPSGVYLAYGTAGFRAVAELLPSTFLRMGMLAALRARKTGQDVGVMITASHNPVQDNGIKIVDPDGGMLAIEWEKHATELANAEETDVLGHIQAIIEEEGISKDAGATVHIARDTRPSSVELADLVKKGAEALAASVIDHNLLTTPQLHYIVRMTNFKQKDIASEEGYYKYLAEAYTELTKGTSREGRGKLIVDSAFGVGAEKLTKLVPHFKGLLDIDVRNSPGEGELNHEVGAEFVQKERLPPKHGIDKSADASQRICSFDGDADRVVYHYYREDGTWRLLDGDKIAALCAAFFKAELAAAGINITSAPATAGEMDDGKEGEVKERTLSVGVVQTAYANGASTMYIKNTVGMPVPIAKTGVKFVHHKATEYDVGVYFEANGHGTVLFSQKALDMFKQVKSEAADSTAETAINRLLASARLINQAVGDAISDALFIEAVLTVKNWTIQDWDAMYEDLPSRQGKVKVPDRRLFVPVADETRLEKPESLQQKIDELVKSKPTARAFVRPSGTEDVVRIYAEAAEQQDADDLAQALAAAINAQVN